MILPEPDMTEENPWKKIVMLGRTAPFGYMEDPDEPGILLPIQRELELLEQAKRYLKQYGSRPVAAWLSEQSGRHISHAGLLKRIKSEKKRFKDAQVQRYLAERYKEALAKAEKLEASQLGARVKPEE
jgi:hypothetical protein